MPELLTIIGDEGEGGGQILRTSLSLSSITQKPFRLVRIRGKRRKPGLQKQHLVCVQSTAEATSAEVQGAHLSSSEIHFFPKEIRSGKYHYDLEGAGSTLLVAQTLLPVLAFGKAPSTLTLHGGTHNDMAPPFDFVKETLIPFLKPMGFSFQLHLEKHGFYPQGGGKLHVEIEPYRSGIPLHLMERGQEQKKELWILHSPQSTSLVKKALQELLESFASFGVSSDHVFSVNTSAKGPGMVLLLHVYSPQGCQIFTSFCPQKESTSQWVQSLVQAYQESLKSKAFAEEYLTDQLLLYLALQQKGQFLANPPLSLHSTTNMTIIEKFLPVRFQQTPQEEGILISVDHR
jgi:RNA 3'-terminal phosphate cyclase (ATP)